jgi:exopolysaccharide production protein ExoQ
MYNPRFIEKAFAVISLFFYTGAIAPFVSETHVLYPVKQALPNVCFTITLLLIIPRWKRVLNIILKEKILWILLAIAIASPLWSDTPMVTLEVIIPLVRVTIFGIYLATCYSFHEQLQIFTWMFGIASFLSLVFGLFLPTYGVVGQGFVANIEDSIHTNAWRGIYVHKNDLGNMMCFSVVTFFLNAIANSKYRQIMWTGFIISVAVIFGSTSQTALLVVLLAMLLIPFYKALRWHHTKALPFFIITILIGGIIAILSISSAETVLTSLGRDITFTGRTEIWDAVVGKIQQRPWLGYGYETFWLGGWEGETADVWRELGEGFEATHAHNGFLQICLGLGFIGMVIFGISFVSIGLQALNWARYVKGSEGLIPLVYLTPLLLINLSESRLMIGSIYWIIYVTIKFSMHSHLNKLNIWNIVDKRKIKMAFN